MKEETKLELAKLTTELTIELLKDRQGHFNSLIRAKGLEKNADPLTVFSEVYSHLSATITKE